jgi:hypothetical protein
MAARRVCQSLSQDLNQDRQQGLTMLPTKASCAMSVDRSSRGTKRAPSKSAGRIRAGVDASVVEKRTDAPEKQQAQEHPQYNVQGSQL